MPNSYTKGAFVRTAAEFRNEAGDLADPTNVFYQAIPPTGATLSYAHPTDPALVKDAVGKYHVDLNVNKAGTWKYKFYSTGQVQAAVEKFFDCPASPFT